MMEQITVFDFLRGDERTVERISREKAKPFVESIHYSQKYPTNVTHSFGLFEGGVLIGVCTYGVPASPPLCKGIAGEKNKDRVLELNRLAIRPGFNGNNRASYLVSHSLKMLPSRTYVVSYADTRWTHIGYVYQACNFLYTGCTKERKDKYTPNGKHSRHYLKNSGFHQMRSAKHRYVYLVGNRREVREMRKELRYPVLDEYPKGDERRYDTNDPQMAIPIQVFKDDGDSIAVTKERIGNDNERINVEPHG